MAVGLLTTRLAALLELLFFLSFFSVVPAEFLRGKLCLWPDNPLHK